EDAASFRTEPGRAASTLVRRPQATGCVLLGLAAALATISGCASVPKINDTKGLSAPEQPTVIGTRGALSSQQINALFDNITDKPEDVDLLARHVAVEQALVDSPLVAGNSTQLLRDGPETFRAMFAAIKGATRYINLEYYEFQNVESDGVHIADLLLEK